MAVAEPAAGGRSDLPVRLASALAMVAVAGAALWLGGWVLDAFVALIVIGVMVEWTQLVVAFASRGVARAIWLVAGVGYLGLAADVAVHLNGASGGGLGLVVTSVIAVDVGAYFTGRAVGGPKIAPAISPSKTWSGLAGAMLAASAVFMAWVWVANRAMDPAVQRVGMDEGGGLWFDLELALLCGVLVAIVAQLGDFFESWMKRRAGVKDSGRLIPGHGGLFDRADGLIAVLFVIGVLALVTRGADGRSLSLPFKGEVGGGGSPPGAARGERPRPNPAAEGEGPDRVSTVQFRLVVSRVGR